MVDSLWFVLALVLLAVVSVALVLVLVLQREEAHCGRETRTEYLQPNYGQTGGFRVSFAPSNETIISYRYWLIEGQVCIINGTTNYTVFVGACFQFAEITCRTRCL